MYHPIQQIQVQTPREKQIEIQIRRRRYQIKMPRRPMIIRKMIVINSTIFCLLSLGPKKYIRS